MTLAPRGQARTNQVQRIIGWSPQLNMKSVKGWGGAGLWLSAAALACTANRGSAAPPALGPSATVAAFGYCADVAAATCGVRAWWPHRSVAEATGVEAYWLATSDGRVCFVSRADYSRAVVGGVTACRWQERRS